MSKSPDQNSERKVLDEMTVRRAMFELRKEIREGLKNARRLAPTWDLHANTIRIGPGCCLPPTQAARTPKPRRG